MAILIESAVAAIRNQLIKQILPPELLFLTVIYIAMLMLMIMMMETVILSMEEDFFLFVPCMAMLNTMMIVMMGTSAAALLLLPCIYITVLAAAVKLIFSQKSTVCGKRFEEMTTEKQHIVPYVNLYQAELAYGTLIFVSRSEESSSIWQWISRFRNASRIFPSVACVPNIEHPTSDEDGFKTMTSRNHVGRFKSHYPDDFKDVYHIFNLSLLVATLIMIGTLLAASTYAAIHNQLEEKQDSISMHLFVVCNSVGFVTASAVVISLLHEFPLRPWPQMAVSMLLGPYMLLVFKISPNEALPLLVLSIPTLLFAAAGKLIASPVG